MPTLPSTHDETKPSARMNLLDRLAGAIGSLVATRPVHFIALLGLCAAYIQGGLDKLLDFNAAVAETQSFGLPFAATATAATIVTELAGSALILTGIYRWLGALWLAGFTLFATFVETLGRRAHPAEAMRYRSLNFPICTSSPLESRASSIRARLT